MNQLPTIRIREREVGSGRPVYVIAELSGNHNGNIDRAIALCRAAKDAGADAIKLQTYTADTLTISSSKEYFRIGGGTAWDGRTLYDLYREAFTPWEWHPKLRDVAKDLGLDFFSSAFDETAVEFLEALGVPVHKVASFENVDIPLIQRMGRTGKPVIVSTGMASLAVVEEAVTAAREAGASHVALLKCTSAYPAPPEDINLHTIPDLANRFSCPVGLSDHTMGIAVPVAATALGACIVEKHLTLARADGGPDSSFSLEPAEFRSLVIAVRTAEKALGSVHYGLTDAEKSTRVFQRSLFVVRDVAAGERFTAQNVRSIRPGYGLHPRYLREIIGQSAATDIERGTPMEWKFVAEREKEKGSA